MSSGNFAGMPQFRHPTLLMCPPRFFDVQYVINPWMEGNLHAASHTVALAQWTHLHGALSALADVLLVEPEPALPDMVFTANAALVRDGMALVSRFRCPERQGEETHFRAWLAGERFTLHEMPPEIAFEGEGDALWTSDGGRLWAGYGWRTSFESHTRLRELWPDREVTSLRLVDPRFYHLDTCFAPLANGDLLLYPPAFDEASRAAIEAFYPAERRIAVSEADAVRFACNAVCLGQTVVLNEISPALCDVLQARGYTVVQVPLGEFLKAGGAAKCLCLRLA